MQNVSRASTPRRTERMQHASAIERFQARYEVLPNGCWDWTAALREGGYGTLSVGGSPMSAHRFAYRYFVGPVPKGRQLDHVCHTLAVERGECAGGPTCAHRRCVNPAHMEPVTSQENTKRGLLHLVASQRKMAR